MEPTLHLVCVFDHYRFPVLGNVAGNGVLADRQHHLAKRNLDGIVLRHLEAQKFSWLAMITDRSWFLFRILFLNQIDGAGVGMSNFTALGEDEFQQLARFVLSAERSANVVEFVDFRVRKSQLVVGFTPRLHQVHVVDGVIKHSFQQRRPCVYGQICVNSTVKTRIAETLISERNYAHVGSAQQLQVFREQAWISEDENGLSGQSNRLRSFKAAVLNSRTLLDHRTATESLSK